MARRPCRRGARRQLSAPRVRTARLGRTLAAAGGVQRTSRRGTVRPGRDRGARVGGLHGCPLALPGGPKPSRCRRSHRNSPHHRSRVDVWRSLPRHLRTGLLLAAPSAWVLLETLRAHALGGAPWALLGQSQHALLPVAQIAELGGVASLSFLVLMPAAALAASGRERVIG